MADMVKKLRENAVAVPHDVYSWFNPLLNEAAAEIERLRAALKTTVDALEALRRGHGAEVSGLCYPALNVGRATLEQKETGKP